MDHILNLAKQKIAVATKEGAVHIMLEMIISADPPHDSDYGAITDGHCSRCKTGV